MRLSIADLEIEIKNCNYDYIINKTRKYQSGSVGPADMTINCFISENIPKPNGKTIDDVEGWSWCISDNGEISMYHIYSEGVIGSLIKWNKDFSVADAYAIDTFEKSGLEIFVKFFIIIRHILWYAIVMKDGIMLHSSALCYKGEGILFSAPSGTGKSTQSSLWKKEFGDEVVIINDDTPFIRNIDSVSYVYGCPWSGKTDINEQIKVPVKAVISVKQGNENSVKKLTATEGFFRIFNETKKPVESNMLDKAMDNVITFLSRTDVYELTCRPEKEAVYALKEVLF